MTKGIIYYTDNRLGNPIRDTVRHFIKASGLPIVSTSLSPIRFGKNIVLKGHTRSYPTYLLQIYTALENLDTKYVFFCEHDVLYHESHFEFTPKEDDVFYYNNNVWRWKLHNFKLTRYEGMRPLSCLSVNREFALAHFKKRIEKAKELNLSDIRSRAPRTGTIWSYEPGTKPTSRGGFSDDKADNWFSNKPNVDIRHDKTFTSIKLDRKDFKKIPKGYEEINYDEIPGWDLKALFGDAIKNHTLYNFSDFET
jgi:hypothetical protein